MVVGSKILTHSNIQTTFPQRLFGDPANGQLLFVRRHGGPAYWAMIDDPTTTRHHRLQRRLAVLRRYFHGTDMYFIASIRHGPKQPVLGARRRRVRLTTLELQHRRPSSTSNSLCSPTAISSSPHQRPIRVPSMSRPSTRPPTTRSSCVAGHHNAQSARRVRKHGLLRQVRRWPAASQIIPGSASSYLNGAPVLFGSFAMAHHCGDGTANTCPTVSATRCSRGARIHRERCVEPHTRSAHRRTDSTAFTTTLTESGHGRHHVRVHRTLFLTNDGTFMPSSSSISTPLDLWAYDTSNQSYGKSWFKPVKFSLNPENT